MLSLFVALAAPRFQTFTVDYVSATAKKVQFAGDLTGWDKPRLMDHSGDHWTISFKLPPNSRAEYKLVVDGKWILDPANPVKVDNGMGGQNSVFQGRFYWMIPGEDVLPKHPLHRKVIKVGGREIILYSPDSPAGKPMLVFGDGPMYESHGHIENYVGNLIDQKRIQPVVLVLVPPTDRLKEYGPNWKTYAKYLFGSVLPAARKATGASAKATDLYLGGSSMGGVISLRLAEEYPSKVAGGVLSQSGAFQWTPLKLDNTDIVKASALKKLAPTTKLYLDYGAFEDELAAANKSAMQTLHEMNRPFEWAVSNEGHNWTAWRHRMVKALVSVLGSSAATKPVTGSTP